MENKNIKQNIITQVSDNSFQRRVIEHYEEINNPSSPIYSDGYRSELGGTHTFKSIPHWFVLEEMINEYYGSPACSRDSMFYNADYAKTRAAQVLKYADQVKDEIIKNQDNLPKTKVAILLQRVKKVEEEYAAIRDNDGMEQ